jgi:chloride channel protein, CIC family
MPRGRKFDVRGSKTTREKFAGLAEFYAMPSGKNCSWCTWFGEGRESIAPINRDSKTPSLVLQFRNTHHRKEGLIRARVAPIKMLASAVTIGSGGAAGREGPIALTAASLGSVYARLAHRSEAEHRLLLLAGMAAGLSAIFRSPMGTGVFAIEVLYGRMEFEVGALLYTMLWSAVAYTVNGAFVGFRSWSNSEWLG